MSKNTTSTPGLVNARSDDPLTKTNVRSGDTSLSRTSWRLAIGLFLGAVLWMMPYTASLAILMPAHVAEVSPGSKVAVVTLLSTVGAVLSLISNVVFGALSDITRTRIGARLPWIVGGAVVTAVSLWLFAQTATMTTLVLCWALYMVSLNAIIAPMVAVIADRSPAKYRGTISAIYGLGTLIGATLSSVVAAGYVAAPANGLVVFGAMSLASAVVFGIVAPVSSNRGEQKAPLNVRAVLRTFRPPVAGARDFYFALFGKFGVVAGLYAVSNYQLYILTDYIKLTEDGAARIIILSGLITLGTALIFGLTSGPLSDRLGVRKPFVIASALVIAVGVAFPLIAPAGWAMLVFALLSGIGNGAFASVDQALNIDVLPEGSGAAKDLGILNIANSGGQVVGPIIMSTLVTITDGYRAGFLASVVLLVVSALLILPIRSVR